MSEKGKIKVIKRVDKAAKRQKAPPKPSAAQTAREMVSTVSEWVGELKEKKGAEARKAIDTLFRGPAPNES